MKEYAQPTRKSADIIKDIDRRASQGVDNPTIADILTSRRVSPMTIHAIKGSIHAIIGGCRATVFPQDMKGRTM